MSSVNERQEGGGHYRSRYQHWDLIEDHGIGYLEGCASKYVTRWRRKNGAEDLKKGRHYMEKVLELHLSRGRPPRGVAPREATRAFAAANDLNALEDSCVHSICSWANQEDLQRVLVIFDELLKAA